MPAPAPRPADAGPRSTPPPADAGPSADTRVTFCSEVDASGAVARDATVRVRLTPDAGCFCGDRPLCVVSRRGADVHLRVGTAAPPVSCEACLGLTIECRLPDLDPGTVGVRINDEIAGTITIADAPADAGRTERCTPIRAPTLQAPWHAAQLERVEWAICRDDDDDGHRRSHECYVARTGCAGGLVRTGSTLALCMPDSIRCARIERDLARVVRVLRPAPQPGSVRDVCPPSSAGTDRRTLRTLRRADDVYMACQETSAAADLARIHSDLTQLCDGQ